MSHHLSSCLAHVQPDTCIIRLWPDGTWAVVDDINYGDYDHMSDDYRDVDLFTSSDWYNLPLQFAIIDELGLN